MADAYDGRDGSKRRTYRLSLRRPLSDNNGAAMQWGDEYRALHTRIIDEMVRVCRPGGLIVVNMGNHIRAGVEQKVVEWWTSELIARCVLVEVRRIPTPGFRFGANYRARNRRRGAHRGQETRVTPTDPRHATPANHERPARRTATGGEG